MKKIQLLILGLTFSLFVQAQTPQTYKTFGGDVLNLYKYEGEKVMLLAKSDTFDITIMKKWMDAMDGAYNFYKTCMGREPKWMSSTYINQKLTIASVHETCGAGCGYVGWTGIEIVDDYFELYYNSIKNENKYEQIIFYELGRNFWLLPEKLHYDNAPITTGYAVFMRFMSMKYLGVDDYPSHIDFFNSIRELKTLYLEDSNLDWSNTLGVGLGVPGSPWGGADLFASFCFYLEETYGMQWVQNVWKYAGERPDWVTTQDAVDNFVIASSQAANTSLVSLFQEWRWTVSQSAIDYLDSLRLGEPTFYLDNNGITIKCINCVSGDIGMVNGILYEAVDRNLLLQRRDEGADLSKLCTSLVTDMDMMFNGKSAFNQNISSWDVSNVLKLDSMFLGAETFNQNIGYWNVGSVYTMEAMFGGATSFNQNIGAWDVKNVTNMSAIFMQATSFNQNLNNWCVSNIATEPTYFSSGSALLEENKPVWGNCPYTYVPDDNFEQVLIDLGYDSGELDDYVLTANIENVTNLDVAHKNINDLTGIEDFSSLITLQCRENHLLNVEVSQNKELLNLDCSANPIASIDISQNTSLEYLESSNMLLENLVVSQNKNLQYLGCSGNQLVKIDLSQNIELQQLICVGNPLNILDVSYNKTLNYLNCWDTKLSSLDVSQNTSLAWLNCGFNSLTTIDLSQNGLIRELYCTNNLFTSLDISQNDSLVYFSCENNQLTFESLEPAIGIENFTYSPQDSVGKLQDATRAIGESFSYSLEVGGEHNIYQWYKDDVLLSSQTSAMLDLANLELDDAGVYRCEITNSVVSELTLYSREIVLVMVETTHVDGDRIFDSLKVYPNPTRDILYVESSSVGKITIFNLDGKIVLKKQIINTQNEFDISTLVSGTYLLRFNTCDNAKTMYFIKY